MMCDTEDPLWKDEKWRTWRLCFSKFTLRRILCSGCFLALILVLFFSSVFRPGSKFYNEEQLLKALPEAPYCIVIVAVSVKRMTYKNTLKHLELSLSEPCIVIVSEDTAYWQRSNPLVLDYVNRNSKWFYAKHASPLFGIMPKFSQWLQSFSSPLLDRVPLLKEIVIVPSVNSYTIHFYDILIRHDAVQFSRWVSTHLLVNS